MTVSSLAIATLSAAFARGTLRPEAVLDEVYRRIAERGLRPVWITLVPRERAFERLAEARRRQAAGAALPLFGIPFAIKDNIDAAGLATTAGCPDFAYVAERSATAVERLEAAGAILIGKTNLDQFATGLVGTRSPYGTCSSVFDDRYIAGGSSAGSGVAVAAGLVSFALGTDTAGSGRVPAGFNNIVGLKPTKGVISTHGVVPACRSQDCVSIFAGTVDDALAVFDAAAGFDEEDSYAQQSPDLPPTTATPLRVGVPVEGLEFFGDNDAAALYQAAVDRMIQQGAVAVDIDFGPFREAAALLYQGPWVAERVAAIKGYGFALSETMDPTVRGILAGAEGLSAVAAFEGFYRLAALTRAAEAEWRKMDVMLLPTTGTTYTIEAVQAEPVKLNSTLGYYTNFVNLMDLSAVAVPAGFRPNGLPFGVTLVGRAFADRAVAAAADTLHRALPAATIGATGVFLTPVLQRPAVGGAELVRVAVVGAHLSGQPLNTQLTSRGARLVETVRTAAGYSFYALGGTVPPKPGLVFDGAGAGLIELEIWELAATAFGSFVAGVPAPLAIGTVRLEDGRTVQGFVCEAFAVKDAEDITGYGGWRRYLARDARAPTGASGR